jgi:hypothetical protein
MPEEDRGVLLVIFLANALIVTFLNAVLVGLVARAVYQGWRSRHPGLLGALRAAAPSDSGGRLRDGLLPASSQKAGGAARDGKARS